MVTPGAQQTSEVWQVEPPLQTGVEMDPDLPTAGGRAEVPTSLPLPTGWNRWDRHCAPMLTLQIRTTLKKWQSYRTERPGSLDDPRTELPPWNHPPVLRLLHSREINSIKFQSLSFGLSYSGQTNILIDNVANLPSTKEWKIFEERDNLETSTKYLLGNSLVSASAGISETLKKEHETESLPLQTLHSNQGLETAAGEKQDNHARGDCPTQRWEIQGTAGVHRHTPGQRTKRVPDRCRRQGDASRHLAEQRWGQTKVGLRGRLNERLHREGQSPRTVG